MQNLKCTIYSNNMNGFIYQYPVKQYFGNGCAEEAIKTELKKLATMCCWLMEEVR